MKLALVAALALLAPGLTAPAAPSALKLAPGVKPPPPSIARVTLPTGRLQAVAMSPDSGYFIDLERTGARQGDDVDLWLYVVMAKPVEMGGKTYASVMGETTLHCEDQANTDVGVIFYDEADQAIAWLAPNGRRDNTKGSIIDLAARALCAGEVLEGETVVGKDAAVKLVQRRTARDRR